MKRPTRSAVVALLLNVSMVSCGGGSGLAPTATPPMMASPSDFAGTWVQADGLGRTWNLTAGAVPVGMTSVIQVVGPASISQANHPSFGSMSARGGVIGTVVVGITGLQFAETYEGVMTPLFPFPPHDCYIDTEGQVLTLVGDAMTIVVTEHDGCDGFRVRDVTSTITMHRKSS